MRKLAHLIAICCLSNGLWASTFTVTNTNDAGSGSLREAMTFCNLTPGADNVAFNIPGMAPHTIMVLSALPTLNDPGTTIDATTQPANGYTGSSRKIIVDGSSMASGYGIEVNGANFVLKGMRIQNFPYHGLVLNSGATGYVIGGVNQGNTISENGYAGVVVNGASGGTFKGNHIGTDDDGNLARPNLYEGLSLYAGANNTAVGGTATGEGNVISGNSYYGLQLDGVSNCMVYGNKIGVNAAGTAAIPNDYYGILITNNGSNNLIGSAVGSGGNVISGNRYHGIAIECSNGTVIKANKIGTDITGSVPIPNEYSGIDIGPTSISFLCNATNNVIGGIGQNEGNTIANNLYYGVNIWGTNAKYNPVRGNRIFCNSYDGFTLHDGNYGQPDGNNGYAAPVITSANLAGATGTAAPNDMVDLYLDDACTNCEPMSFVATVTANGSGAWSYSGALSGSLTAIATHATNGNSSANSPCTFISNSNLPTATFMAINREFCGNGCTSFIDFSTGQPTSWSWTFPGGTPSSSNLQNPQNICWNSPGLYDVSLTVTNLSGSSSTTLFGYITVGTVPTVDAGPDAAICSGGQAVLAGQSNGGYLWSPGNTLSDSTVANPIASPTTTTAYVLTGQIGDCAASDTMLLTILPLPVVTINQNGNLLSATTGLTFQWFLNGSPIPGANSQSYTALVTGNYSVTVTDANGCSGSSPNVLVVVVGLSDKLPDMQVIAMPNPTQGKVEVAAEGCSETEIEISVSDLLGRVLMKCTALPNQGKIQIPLDISHLPNGIYDLELGQDGHRVTRKLILEK